MNGIFLNEIHADKSWDAFLNEPDNICLLTGIENSLDTPFTPTPNLALRFLSVGLKQTKIIILGQDPYPQEGVATGRAFEVNGLTRWEQKFKQSSIRNILRNLHASYNDCEPVALSKIREEITAGIFNLPSPDKIFDYWQYQGVLCLNTAFTCQIGKPGSHRHYWSPFTDRLISYIASFNPNIIWFLWGKPAQKYEPLLNGARTIKCNHPMLPGSGKDGFINCNCFRDTKHIINWI